MQEQDTRRSIMLSAETHTKLTELTKELDCTHNAAVETLLQLVDREDLKSEIKERLAAAAEARTQAAARKRELAAKISMLSPEDVAELLEKLSAK